MTWTDQAEEMIFKWYKAYPKVGEDTAGRGHDRGWGGCCRSLRMLVRLSPPVLEVLEIILGDGGNRNQVEASLPRVARRTGGYFRIECFSMFFLFSQVRSTSKKHKKKPDRFN